MTVDDGGTSTLRETIQPSTTYVTVVAIALVLFAGCAQPVQNGTARPPTSSDSPIETTSPVGTGDLLHDLTVRNFRDDEVTLDVTVTANRSGGVLFQRTLALAPNASEDFDLQFPDTGKYTILTRENGTSYEYVWHVERTPPSFEVIVTASSRGNVTYLESSG